MARHVFLPHKNNFPYQHVLLKHVVVLEHIYIVDKATLDDSVCGSKLKISHIKNVAYSICYGLSQINILSSKQIFLKCKGLITINKNKLPVYLNQPLRVTEHMDGLCSALSDYNCSGLFKLIKFAYIFM